MKDSIAKFLANKFVKKWLSENEGMIDDLERISVYVAAFNSKYGTKLNIVFESK